MCAVQLYMWRENDHVVRRCRWLTPRMSLAIDHFAVGAQYLAVISNDGQAFTGSIPDVDSSPDLTLSGELHFLEFLCS